MFDCEELTQVIYKLTQGCLEVTTADLT